MSEVPFTLPLGGSVTESVEAWWARRQWSKETAVPYAIGSYRSDWERYPVLIRQYHPDLNHGIVLTQIPPAADVLLVWQCDTGHIFVATPEEQRNRPGRTRRRSVWCPDCSALADPPRIRRPAESPPPETYSCGHQKDPRRVPTGDADDLTCALCRRLAMTRLTRAELERMAAPASREGVRAASAPTTEFSWACTSGHGTYRARVESIIDGRRCPVCAHARAGADRVQPGEAFQSSWAPPRASAAEGDLRHRLAQRISLDMTPNAVKVGRPFFNHIEVWPDIVFPDLKVAIEYDTIGKFGLEHVGKREATDRRKDKLLREVGWEVIRIRCGKLQPLGPHDILATGVNTKLIDRLLDELREVRGSLFVDAYLA